MIILQHFFGEFISVIHFESCMLIIHQVGHYLFWAFLCVFFICSSFFCFLIHFTFTGSASHPLSRQAESVARWNLSGGQVRGFERRCNIPGGRTQLDFMKLLAGFGKCW